MASKCTWPTKKKTLARNKRYHNSKEEGPQPESVENGNMTNLWFGIRNFTSSSLVELWRLWTSYQAFSWYVQRVRSEIMSRHEKFGIRLDQIILLASSRYRVLIDMWWLDSVLRWYIWISIPNCPTSIHRMRGWIERSSVSNHHEPVFTESVLIDGFNAKAKTWHMHSSMASLKNHWLLILNELTMHCFLIEVTWISIHTISSVSIAPLARWWPPKEHVVKKGRKLARLMLCFSAVILWPLILIFYQPPPLHWIVVRVHWSFRREWR